MKDDVLQSLREDIDSLVDTRVKELYERKRRDCNGLLFSLPEPRRHLAEENKAADEDGLHLGLENLQIVTLFRLGRLATGKCRPLKVVLQSKAHRKYLLDNARFIKDKAPENMKNVIIVRDFTPVQRQERRNRLANRGARVENNEVRDVNEASSNQDSHNQPTAMQVNNTLSPILPMANLMSSTHLSQLNQYTDSQQVRDLSAIYDHTTIIEKTIVGGLRQGNTLQEPTSPDINDI